VKQQCVMNMHSATHQPILFYTVSYWQKCEL